MPTDSSPASSALPWLAVVDHHPPDWQFPAQPSWIAGWMEWAPSTAPVTDLRAWIDGRPFLGLHGLPRAGDGQPPHDLKGARRSGFSFLLRPHRGARQLRLECRDAHGTWHELLRRQIAVAPEAEQASNAPTSAFRLGELQLEMLRQHARRPEWPLSTLAENLVASAIAEPLDCLPNPPLHGALEGPTRTGYLRYGRLEVHGWLAHRTAAIMRLVAVTEPGGEITLRHGLPRQGVENVFAELRDRDRCQFVGHIDLPSDSPRPMLLKIFAELDDGTRHLAFAQRFTPQVIQGPEPALPAPLSRTLFARAAWHLLRAGRRHGLEWRPAHAASDLLVAWRLYAAETPRRILPKLAPLPPASRPDAPALRVVVLTHNLNFEGAPWFIFEYARHLAAQPGWQVRVLSPLDGPLREKFVAAGIAVELVDARKVWNASSPREFNGVISRLAQQLEAHAPDLLVANTLVCFWGVHLARAMGCRSLLYIHESAPVRRFFSTLLSPALLPRAEDAFRRAHRVAFIAAASHPVYAHLQRRDNFRLLPSWIDVSGIRRFAAAHDPAELRVRHGIPRDAVVFANIGSVCERKGQHVFVRAAAQLAAEAPASAPPLCFLIVGARPGVYLDALRHDIALLGLQHVIIVDEVPDTYPYYRLADIFVCSSFEEAFPRVLMEAAAFGLPIVSTHVSGIPEMLAPDEAWLTPPGSADAMAGAMRHALGAHLAGDRERAERAQKSVSARFSAEASLPLHRALAQEAGASRA